MSFVSYGIASFNTNRAGSNSGNYSLGIRFQLAEEKVVVGFRIFSTNLSNTVTMKLWDSTKQLVTSATGQRVPGAWVEFTLSTPVTLMPDSEYRLAYYSGGSYEWWNLADIVVSDGFTLLGACEVSGDTYPSGNSTAYWGVDVIFDETPPYDKKYLIRSSATLYSVTDGTLTALAETEITASLFQTYGVDEIPDGALLVGLTDPEVLYWHDSTDELPTLSLTVRGTPPLPQMFTSEPMDLTHESIAGISHAVVDASEDVRFAISFDGGATWKAHDGAAWFDTSDTVPGMLASTMNAITAEQWAEVVVLESYMVRFWLPNVTAFVKSVVIHYINP